MTDLSAADYINSRRNLLAKVHYRAALAYFSVANRNQPLFMALVNMIDNLDIAEPTTLKEKATETCFNKMIR